MHSALTSPDNYYRTFVDLVQRSVQAATVDQEVQRLLNGAAADEVHAKIPRPLRAKDGIFFSGHSLAQETANFALDAIQSGAKIFDPACGAGDLLIAAAKLLPLQSSIEKTLDAWGDILGGSDLHQTFVDATKWRLALLAKNRHGLEGDLKDIKFSQLFCGIKQLDYLSNPTASDGYDCILVNPPFGHRTAPDGCAWSSGRTQLAAIFIEKVFLHRRDGQIVVAILPDVLRGGTRYKRWRQMIACKANTVDSKIYGRFEKRTDVDVFISRYECSSSASVASEITKPAPKADTVETLFSIKVGSVVPHKHTDKKGAWKPYLKVSNAPANGETEVKQNRRFNGSCFETPFVAIRRTSNPSDKQRIICTVVTGPELVAVENHLIVASARSKNIDDCRRLAKLLSSEQVTHYINSQLRCRHLTTGALKSVPLLNWEG